MSNMYKTAFSVGACAAMMMSGATLAYEAPPADWSAVPAHTVKRFYPRESPYDWLRSSSHKRA